MNPAAFQPGGVTQNPQGFAYGQPMNSGLNMFAQMQLLKGFSGDSSYSSSSSKISIVKYDDYFKSKTWCVDNLKKSDGTPLTAEEVKANPPLCLKFGDCPVVIPIPSYKGMCATADHLIRELMTPAAFDGADTKTKKGHADVLSRALAVQYVEDCGYGADRFQDSKCTTTRLPPYLQDANDTQILTNETARQTALAAGTRANSRYLRDIMDRRNP